MRRHEHVAIFPGGCDGEDDMSAVTQQDVALADLHDHEKVIEQGLATFVEVGWSLLKIRDGKKYKAAGFETFEHYCMKRWSMGRKRAYDLMGAAEVAAVLSPNGDTEPASEGQVRALTALKNNPDQVREAWAEAVAEAETDGREQPTAQHVERAVAKRREPKRRDHPAPFSDPILDTIASKVTGADTVLDPFAGTGRVHELRDKANVVNTIGVEIEPEWAAKHPDTIQGNALDLPLDDESVDAVATSPTYGNRMADHHDAKDESTRVTYKHTLGRDLHDDNSGAMQWGDEYCAFHLKAWAEAVRVLKPGGLLVVNVKDHIRGGVKQEVVAWHNDVLGRVFGLKCVGHDIVASRGTDAGANAGLRVLGEVVLTFRKSS